MKIKTLSVLAVGGTLLVSGIPLLAHHSFAAEYDSTKPITLKGAVTKMEWQNPHARFYVDVKDDGGAASTVSLTITVTAFTTYLSEDFEHEWVDNALAHLLLV